MDIGAAFRECLATLDVAMARRLWRKISPHLPQPENDAEALYTLHVARTKTCSMSNRQRAWSVAWLEEHGPVPEPVIARAAGSASMSSDPGMKRAVQSAMTRAVQTALDGGMDLETHSLEIRRQMLDARAQVRSGRLSV